MKGAGSKAKGSDFERSVCRKLSLWMSRGLRDDLFWRSAMSGGRATVQFNKGAHNATQAGDISAIDPQGARLTNKVLIECKSYRNLHLESLFYGRPKDGILAFWSKCIEEADRCGKRPLLIAKQNAQEPLVMYDADIFDLYPTSLVFLYRPFVVLHKPDYIHPIFVTTLTEFLKHARRP